MTSAITRKSENGTTAHAASAEVSEITGASTNSARFAPAGTTSSLNMSFTASATGCSHPFGPTRLGPRRTCMYPMTLRSA